MMKIYILAAVISTLTTLAVESKEFPNSAFTNSHFCSRKDPDFKEYRYKQNIPVCERNVSYNTRKRVYEKYKISADIRRTYTIDHLVPLSLGGSNNEKNLWPQPRAQSTAPLETEIYYKVKRGEITIQEAWNIISKEKYSE